MPAGKFRAPPQSLRAYSVLVDEAGNACCWICGGQAQVTWLPHGLMQAGFVCGYCRFAIRTAQEGLYDMHMRVKHAQGNIEAVTQLLEYDLTPAVFQLVTDYLLSILDLIEMQLHREQSYEGRRKLAAFSPRKNATSA